MRSATAAGHEVADRAAGGDARAQIGGGDVEARHVEETMR